MNTHSLQISLQKADTKRKRVNILFEYLKAHGDELYEEEVTQLQHALQAAQLARVAGKSSALVTAALFHDLGHILADDPNEQNNPTLVNDHHEEIASVYLRDLFPQSVLEPIRLHVLSKRYLCTTKPGYYDRLSEASQKSFHLQGGTMNEAEIEEFEGHQFYEDAVLLRVWDDLAKDINGKPLEIDEFLDDVVEAMIDC